VLSEPSIQYQNMETLCHSCYKRRGRWMSAFCNIH